MLLSVVLSLTTVQAVHIVKHNAHTNGQELYKANTSYTLGAKTDNSCAKFDLKEGGQFEVEGGNWECDTFDERGQCKLKCTTGYFFITNAEF